MHHVVPFLHQVKRPLAHSQQLGKKEKCQASSKSSKASCKARILEASQIGSWSSNDVVTSKAQLVAYVHSDTKSMSGAFQAAAAVVSQCTPLHAWRIDGSTATSVGASHIHYMSPCYGLQGIGDPGSKETLTGSYPYDPFCFFGSICDNYSFIIIVFSIAYIYRLERWILRQKAKAMGTRLASWKLTWELQYFTAILYGDVFHELVESGRTWHGAEFNLHGGRHTFWMLALLHTVFNDRSLLERSSLRVRCFMVFPSDLLCSNLLCRNNGKAREPAKSSGSALILIYLKVK